MTVALMIVSKQTNKQNISMQFDVSFKLVMIVTNGIYFLMIWS